MEHEIIEKPKMTPVGIVGCGSDVTDLDIPGLWQRFDEHEESIRHRIGGAYYEVHIQEENSPAMHFGLIGMEVEEIEELPIELFAKVLPAATYAQFTHRLGDGGFGSAFQAVYEWVEASPYAPAYQYDVQVYDERFKGPEDPESVLEILVPVVPKEA